MVGEHQTQKRRKMPWRLLLPLLMLVLAGLACDNAGMTNITINDHEKLNFWLIVLGVSLLPASVMHTWVLTRHWRRYAWVDFLREFQWLLWMFTLVLASASAYLWATLSIYEFWVVLAGAAAIGAVFTAAFTYLLGLINGYPPDALQKPVLLAVLLTLITPLLWALSGMGLGLWLVIGIIWSVAELWQQRLPNETSWDEDASDEP